MAPWLPGFPFDPSECRFIGKPVDFIVFRGASSGAVEEVVLVEVKTAGASLSGVERSLREAVESGRVTWAEYRPPNAKPSDAAQQAKIAAAKQRPAGRKS